MFDILLFFVIDHAYSYHKKNPFFITYYDNKNDINIQRFGMIATETTIYQNSNEAKTGNRTVFNNEKN